jgi:octaheme c-type cytochrome (tetrathionate reductase family)
MQTSQKLCIGASFLLIFYASIFLPPVPGTAQAEQAPGRKLARQVIEGRQSWNTTDHSKHQVLRQNFRSGSEITDACLSCHSEAEKQFKETIHWTWTDPNSAEDTITGKAGHSMNNFCISSNFMKDRMCVDCHAGWDGKRDGVNCLTCHSQKLAALFNSETEFGDIREALASYRDLDGDSGTGNVAADIQKAIREAIITIGPTTRQNCGSCHFYGGGGDGVKHGDLDSAMINPSLELDVHMSPQGQNFQCSRCHTTKLHHIDGRIYSTPASLERQSLLQNDMTSKIMCISCHGPEPHKNGRKINDHTDRVACQSCHIPLFARENPTKMWWDWSQAGKLKDGQPYHEEDEFGKHSYLSKKGEMRWEMNVKPEYFWFDGSIVTLTAKDVIDPEEVVAVSRPLGEGSDENSLIFPFKVHRGKQPYDKVHNTLLPPLVSGPTGFWATLDWESSIAQGAEAMDLPFSGEFDFVETTYVFPITHMVAPSKSAVTCAECHMREQGRMAGLAGIYIPGRDNNKWIDLGGLLLIIASLGGVSLHAVGRMLVARKKRGV